MQSRGQEELDATQTELYARVMELLLGDAERAAEWLPLLEELACLTFRVQPAAAAPGDPRVAGFAAEER